MNRKWAVEGCPNCQLHGWKQLGDRSKLQQCGKCKLIRYCGQDCQVEHWEKVHKYQCSFFRDPAKSLGLRHKEEECVICQKAAEVGQNKIREPDNPNYDCIHKQVQERLPKIIHSHPWKITGEPEDIREKAIIIMWQLQRKFELSQPNASFTCREELEKWYPSLRFSRFYVWIKRMIYPQPEARPMWIDRSDFQKETETIEAKLALLKFSNAMTDPFNLWDTMDLVMNIALDLDLVMILKFLKDPLSNLPDDLNRLVSQGISSAEKYLTEANKVLDALSTQVIPYKDVLKIILGGNLKLNCSFCSEEMIMYYTSPPEPSDEVDEVKPYSPHFRLLTFETYDCGRDDCHEKMIQKRKDCDRVAAAIIALWQEREVNSCDFCFQRLPVKLKNVEAKVHRCRKCLTVTYCSLGCRDQDRKIHIKICKEDPDGRKKKLGVSARKEAARDEVDRLEKLPISRSYHEVGQVFGKFKKKNERKIDTLKE